MTKMMRLFSANSDFQRLEVLKRNRNKRNKYNEFFVEGVRNMKELTRNGWTVTAYIYTEQRRLSDWALGVLASSRAPIHYVLSEALMDQLSDKDETSEIMATVSMPADDLSRITFDENLLVTVFDRPSSKGNLGTIIRSCDALGSKGLIVTGHAVDLYDPETIRATMGSFFNVPSIRLESHHLLVDWISSLRGTYQDLQVVGTSAHAEHYVDECDFTRPTILLLGNETSGLSYAYKEMSDTMVKIPMGGSASSLNVACAASVLLYEIAKQRRYQSRMAD